MHQSNKKIKPLKHILLNRFFLFIYVPISLNVLFKVCRALKKSFFFIYLLNTKKLNAMYKITIRFCVKDFYTFFLNLKRTTTLCVYYLYIV